MKTTENSACPGPHLGRGGHRTAPGALRAGLARRRWGFRLGWTAAGRALLASVLLLGAGCYHQEARRFTPAPPPLGPGTRAKVTLTVNTNLRGPIRYHWAFTNGPNGARILKFTPGE